MTAQGPDTSSYLCALCFIGCLLAQRTQQPPSLTRFTPDPRLFAEQDTPRLLLHVWPALIVLQVLRALAFQGRTSRPDRVVVFANLY